MTTAVNALLLTVAVLAAAAVQAADRRTLVLTAPRADHPQLVAQQAMLDADPIGIAERDLDVVTTLQPQGPERFDVVLIGKDGGTKLRSRAPLSLAALFATIDAMPMRRAERQERAVQSAP